MTEISVSIGTIEEFQDWLSRKGFSNDTLRAYASDVRGFFESNGLKELPIARLETVTAEWINRMRRVWAPRTTQRKVTGMRAFARFHGLKSFLEDYSLPKAAKQRAKPLEGGVTDIDRMLNACSNDVERALIAMLGLCGMRISEALDRSPHDFNLREREIHIRLGKGDKDRIIPLSEAAYSHLSDLVFETWLAQKNRLIEFTDRTARKKVTEIGLRAGLPHIASHMLRATFATAAYDNSGHDIRAVQELLGHSNVSTTQGYVGTTMASMRNAADFGTVRQPIDKSGCPNLPPRLFGGKS